MKATSKASFTGFGLDAAGVEYLRTDAPAESSDLVWKMRHVIDAEFSRAAAVRWHEWNRDLIDWHENQTGDELPYGRYMYENDALGRRFAVTTEGITSGETRFNAFGYNSRSELTSSHRYSGYYIPDPPPASEIVDERRGYNYDHIGNRAQAATGTGAPLFYCANSLNQYELTGAATSCDPPTESFSYDLDGNLTQDSTFDYVWDAENRLIRAATRMDRGTPGVYDNDDQKVECVYDYMSRRVRKTTYTWSGGWVEDADGDQLFVYDRWNVVLVLNANAGSETLRKYTWGLDLSGWMGTPGAAGIHGAGGIGGLLAAEETATAGAPNYWFFCDGNGNVTQILDPNDFWPEPTAHYEYDPYGNLIRALDVDGSGYVNANLFRFSSKWLDTETGLYYYGYRYHDPRLGRWTSEDPFGEPGLALLREQAALQAIPGEQDANLYVICSDSPLDKVDYLGLQALPQPSPEPWPIIPPGFGTPPPQTWGQCCRTFIVDAGKAVVGIGVRYGPTIVRCCRTATFAGTLSYCVTLQGDQGPSAGLVGSLQDSSTHVITEALKDCDICKKKKCKPCVPPVGTKAYSVDSGHKDRGWDPHTHHWTMHQNPNNCQCFWVRNSSKTTKGNSPAPGEIQFSGPAAGGGFE